MDLFDKDIIRDFEAERHARKNIGRQDYTPIGPTSFHKFPIIKLYNSDEELLYVTKSPQLQQLISKDWWNEVDNAKVLHFGTRREQEEAKFMSVHDENPKYNRNSS